MRRTIEELCSQGFLVKRQGKGTFVEIPKIYRKIENDNNMSFSEACRSNGRKPSSHIIERILSADNLPIIYEHIYIPTDFLPDFQVEKLENGSLTRLLNKEYHMKESEKARSTVEVSTVSQPVAGYLRMNEGEPVMILASYINNEKEEPLYISYEIIAGSRYKISI